MASGKKTVEQLVGLLKGPCSCQMEFPNELTLESGPQPLSSGLGVSERDGMEVMRSSSISGANRVAFLLHSSCSSDNSAFSWNAATCPEGLGAKPEDTLAAPNPQWYSLL